MDREEAPLTRRRDLADQWFRIMWGIMNASTHPSKRGCFAERRKHDAGEDEEWGSRKAGDVQ